MRCSKLYGERGFTLVELLIAMALALVIIASLSRAFVIQQKTFNTQEQMAEMTQNSRAAIDIMTREIRMAGYGTPTSNLSSWIDWVSGVAFGTEPIVIEDGAGALGSDIIHIAACFDKPSARLNSVASAGDTSITLKTGEGSKFNTTAKKLIMIGQLENAVITGISGDTLTIDTDPVTSGNQGLKSTHASGEEVCILKVITYSIVQDRADSYVLKRDENVGAGRQPVAENIMDMQITMTNNTVEINPLTARTEKSDPEYTQNNGYRTYDQRAFITPPNLLIQ